MNIVVDNIQYLMHTDNENKKDPKTKESSIK